MSTERKPYTPREIDDTEDRMGSIDQLDFSERQDERQGRVGDERSPEEAEREFPDERVQQAGLSGGETLGTGIHEDGVSMDDVSPETLLDESGARSPREPGDAYPADKELTEVDAGDIGGGYGLDEAELGRRHPLDDKAWDGDPTEPLEPEPGVTIDDELAGDDALEANRKHTRDGGSFGE
ncbi:phosphotransferase system, HPr-related protein [Pseudomonas matsuisoli]|uniref:Phosphotransferase system, HPr-related protein n=1 Tax=Pseudomonas matsuisoli TaxID=1515666 RepID=A0A917V1S0_9PSED|nr:phosphotransferase system, HPr-related protein [Pseudomonas matsuisoli]GGK10189.1 hypothetical protein GCM10009304_40280 [Pseudomonas matsuisoli]